MNWPTHKNAAISATLVESCTKNHPTLRLRRCLSSQVGRGGERATRFYRTWACCNQLCARMCFPLGQKRSTEIICNWLNLNQIVKGVMGPQLLSATRIDKFITIKWKKRLALLPRFAENKPKNCTIDFSLNLSSLYHSNTRKGQLVKSTLSFPPDLDGGWQLRIFWKVIYNL